MNGAYEDCCCLLVSEANIGKPLLDARKVTEEGKTAIIGCKPIENNRVAYNLLSDVP